MTCRHLLIAAACCVLAHGARAEWFGHLGLSTDRIERGISQTDHEFGRSAGIGWLHASGLHIGLGIAAVSDDLYAGSPGYELRPELGWSIQPASDWTTSVRLHGRVFPGARGRWYGRLPSRAASIAVEPESGGYGTAELELALGWRWLSVAWSRSFTNYLGIRAVERDVAGAQTRRRSIGSTGTRYLSVGVDWPVMPELTLSAGVGRLQVAQFDALDYTDWRAGLSYAVGSWTWGLHASGTNAAEEAYRTSDHGEGRNSAERRVTASLRREF